MSLWGGGGGAHTAYNSYTINDFKMEFGGVLENYKLIDLV